MCLSKSFFRQMVVLKLLRGFQAKGSVLARKRERNEKNIREKIIVRRKKKKSKNEKRREKSTPGLH